MTPEQLKSAAETFGTPLYVYDAEGVKERIRTLRDLFAGKFQVSYAIKANPAQGLLNAIRPALDRFDASAGMEVQRALDAGMPADLITFSGPAKKRWELELALDRSVGEVVLESVEEAQELSALAVERGVEQACLLRINPLRIPRKFGASMAGTPSQFGVDEEDLEIAIREILNCPGLKLEGFHIYSGTNCLDASAIAENFEIFVGIFARAADVLGRPVSRLVFGSGMGIPYHDGEEALDHEALPELAVPAFEKIAAHPLLANAQLILELGRWLVGENGWLLTSVVREKHSRGKDLRMCDAGFNNHLAACGMMGSVFRRNWKFENLTNPGGERREYTLVGPLCTSIDRLAADVELPALDIGHVVAIPRSGAYGLTSSPSRFISHPEPREIMWNEGTWADISESLHNHPEGRSK